MDNLENYYKEGNEILTSTIRSTAKRGLAMGMFWGLAIGYFSFWEPDVFILESVTSSSEFLDIVAYGSLLFATLVNIANITKNTFELQKEYGVKNMRYHGWKLGYLPIFCLGLSLCLKYTVSLLEADILQESMVAHGSFWLVGILALIFYFRNLEETES